MNMPKMRGHMPQSRFAAAARQARTGFNGGPATSNFKRPNGLFDRLTLGDKPIWLRLSPDQVYAQLLYSRDTKQVIETGKPEANGDILYPARPWFEYVTHFVPATKSSFTCSAGADRSQPCRGCAVRAADYDRIRAREEATGVKDAQAREKISVQSSTRYGMAVTVLETILDLPLMDKNNKPRKSKDGRDLMRSVPAPLSGYSPIQMQKMQGPFGKNYHWNFGPMHLSQLGSIDMDLWNYCASCAEPLSAQRFCCAQCGECVYDAGSPVREADLRAMREQAMRCTHCRHEGPVVPVVECACGNPMEGNLLTFDLRIRLEKDATDPKKSIIHLVDHRVPDYASMYPAEAANNVYEMVYGPLDIPEIYAPENLDSQARRLPDDLRAVPPDYHLKKKVAKPYGATETEEEEDPDQMSFGD